jgi:hypothetical protein
LLACFVCFSLLYTKKKYTSLIPLLSQTPIAKLASFMLSHTTVSLQPAVIIHH